MIPRDTSSCCDITRLFWLFPVGRRFGLALCTDLDILVPAARGLCAIVNRFLGIRKLLGALTGWVTVVSARKCSFPVGDFSKAVSL